MRCERLGDYSSVNVQRTLEFLASYCEKDCTALQVALQDFYYHDDSIRLRFMYDTAALNKIVLEA
jgi:hypothetical protein